jgi:hypothetical protein
MSTEDMTETPSSPLLTRRKLVKTFAFGALTAIAGTWAYRYSKAKPQYSFAGEMVGGNSKVGHLLRSGVQATPTEFKKINTVIVGGGISGLSAAWWFRKNRFQDFVLLEMDSHTGGNSNFGENKISKYPWGAHYVPIPGPQAHYVRQLFEEIGVIQGYEKGLPVFNEYHLCADFHERLFFQGAWQEGLIPQHGISAEDRRQYDEFFAFVESMKTKKGRDGKHAFAIPMELSSQDGALLQLDKVSMTDWMNARGWSSRYLNWYVNYCCRDDYGQPSKSVSAWAGLHYFASRSGIGANADSQAVLTWPEGNGYLSQRLQEISQSHIQKNSLVFSIENQGKTCQLKVLDTQTNVCTQIEAQNVIFAGPRFTASRVIQGYQSPAQLEYAPWMIANISVKEKPKGPGVSLAWDNVSFYSPSLGYIVANHQELKYQQKETVLTYYLPLDEKSPKEERLAAYQKSREEWLQIILPDLERMHPGISKSILQIDVWIWGHGMVSPGIDFLWNSKRQAMLRSFGQIEFAHSDMSGISIFEEAQYRGVEAARRVLAKAKV